MTSVMTDAPDSEAAKTHWEIRAYKEGDIPALVELINAANEADGLDKRTDMEDLARSFAMPRSDPPKQVIVAEQPDGVAVGYGRILSIDDEAAGARIYQFTIKAHPDSREKGLEEAVAARLMAIARSHNEEANRASVEKVSVLTHIRIENAAMCALFERIGLRNTRHAWEMERSLQEPLDGPRTVEGVSLRAYRRPEDNAAAHIAFHNSFIDHFEFHPITQEAWDYRIEQPDVRPDLSWLAEDEGEPGAIVGFCICEIEDKTNRQKGCKEGWIGLLGTVRGWRGKGLGRALLLHGLHSLKAAGMETALLGVDSESLTGANRLYASVGFTVRHHEVMYKCALADVMI